MTQVRLVSDAEPATEPFPSLADLAQFGRGVLMGGADIIPGVSGGTVALILGIYEQLITSISHCDKNFCQLLLQGRLSAAADYIGLRFLTPLGIGIGCGVVGLGTVMHNLLEDHLKFTLAAFFGLIAASCFLVARMVKTWNAVNIATMFAGALFAVWLVRLPAFTHPPDDLWYVFVCGAIAICAMILPGISGAFILLLLGKYHDITGIIKDALKLDVSLHSISVVLTFASGCFIGLISFSRLLKWLLAKHACTTMAALCGFMAGSLYKIWPYQRDTTPHVEKFKEKVFELIPPEQLTLNFENISVVFIIGAAAASVLLLDRIANHRSGAETLREIEQAASHLD